MKCSVSRSLSIPFSFALTLRVYLCLSYFSLLSSPKNFMYNTFSKYFCFGFLLYLRHHFSLSFSILLGVWFGECYTLFKLFFEMISSLDFRVSFADSVQTLYTRHTSPHRARIFCSTSNFDPTFKVVPLKYMLIFFDLPSKRSFAKPSSFTFKLNFCLLQFPFNTQHTHTLFFFGRSGHCRGRSLNLIFVCLFVIFFYWLLFTFFLVKRSFFSGCLCVMVE